MDFVIFAVLLQQKLYIPETTQKNDIPNLRHRNSLSLSKLVFLRIFLKSPASRVDMHQACISWVPQYIRRWSCDWRPI